jgi:hypothetical protein
MNLPADVARCPGVQSEGQWREGCEDCLRRTAAPIDHPRVAHMAPPDFIVGECPSRIPPKEAA